MESRKGSDFWLNWSKSKVKNRRSLQAYNNGAMEPNRNGARAQIEPNRNGASPRMEPNRNVSRDQMEPNRNGAIEKTEPDRNGAYNGVLMEQNRNIGSPVILREGRAGGGMSRSGPSNPYASSTSSNPYASSTSSSSNPYATYGVFYPGSPSLTKSTPAEGLQYLTTCPSEGSQYSVPYPAGSQYSVPYSNGVQYTEAVHYANPNNNHTGRCGTIFLVNKNTYF